jgi:hypothetical protein
MSSSNQLSLFDDFPPIVPTSPITKLAARASTAEAVVRLSLGPKPATRPRRRPPPSRMLTARDMPVYPAEEIARVERVIAELGSDRLLLGYKDIQNLFGVSKATANRRMKDGMVPGVTMRDGVVNRDSAVRRFTREQVKWLLLAVRSGSLAT